MRIWVVGHEGMLGSEVLRVVRARGHDAWTGGHVFVYSDELLQNIPRREDIDAIINCAGRRPATCYAQEMIEVNAALPHFLATYGIPLIHMSTDCVYSGKFPTEKDAWLHPSTAPVDPSDLYGRTKLVGEVNAPHVTNVRGSFIGLKHGLLRWVLDSEGRTITAWKNAYWNGTTVDIMAAQLVNLAETRAWAGKVVQVARFAPAGNHSKADIIKYIVESANLQVSIHYSDVPRYDRRLLPDIGVGSNLDGLLNTAIIERAEAGCQVKA